MTNEKFTTVVDRRISQCKDVLVNKASEYARGDRLSNFKKAAGAMKCSPERALIGMLMKHVVSIIDFVDDIEAGKVATREQWDEKIGDSINYHILLDGLITERLEE